MQKSLPVAERPRRPEWMKVRAPSANSRYFEVKALMREGRLVTICEEARCPNIGECWGRGTATFQILGDTCTRACRYCYVHSGKPDSPPDPLEPLRLAQAAAQMGLSHVVVTSVDRDDIPDRGAAHYAASFALAALAEAVDVWQTGGPVARADQGGDPDEWVIVPLGGGAKIMWGGLAAGHDRGDEGWHQTPTIDVGVVIDGRVEMHIPGHEPVVLRKGDIGVHRAMNHKWVVRPDGPLDRVTFLFAVG